MLTSQQPFEPVVCKRLIRPLSTVVFALGTLVSETYIRGHINKPHTRKPLGVHIYVHNTYTCFNWSVPLLRY